MAIRAQNNIKPCVSTDILMQRLAPNLKRNNEGVEEVVQKRLKETVTFTSSAADNEANFQRAKEFCDAGDFRKALTHLEKIEPLNPHWKNTKLYTLALVYYELYEPKKAIELLRGLRGSLVTMLLGKCYFSLGMNEPAKSCFSKIPEADIHRLGADKDLALCHTVSREYKIALNYFRKYLSEDVVFHPYESAALTYVLIRTKQRLTLKNLMKKIERLNFESKESYLTELRQYIAGFSRPAAKPRSILMDYVFRVLSRIKEEDAEKGMLCLPVPLHQKS